VDGAAAWESGEQKATGQHLRSSEILSLEAVDFPVLVVPGTRLATDLLWSLNEDLTALPEGQSTFPTNAGDSGCTPPSVILGQGFCGDGSNGQWDSGPTQMAPNAPALTLK